MPAKSSLVTIPMTAAAVFAVGLQNRLQTMSILSSRGRAAHLQAVMEAEAAMVPGPCSIIPRYSMHVP